MSYQYLLVEKYENGHGLVQFNRPRQLNALCTGLLDELSEVLGAEWHQAVHHQCRPQELPTGGGSGAGRD